MLPAGRRPFYCFAVAGLARSSASYLPAGVDYCVLSPQLIPDREFALTGYAPVIEGASTMLGVETPVYRGGVVPATVVGRQRAFVGWLGDLILPNVLLERALAGHPGVAVIFRYDSRFSHVAFSRGKAPAGAQRTSIDLLVGREALGDSREGWTVQSFGAPLAGGVLGNRDALVRSPGGSC